MGDNYNGRDEHLSPWFGMSPNQPPPSTQQQHQQQPDQYQAQPQQMMQATAADDRSVYQVGHPPSTVVDQQQQQVERAPLNHQQYYPSQYPEQQQQQLHYQQSYPHPAMYQQQQQPPQQYPQEIQQQQHQGRETNSIDLTGDDGGVALTGENTYASLFNNYENYAQQRRDSSGIETPSSTVTHNQGMSKSSDRSNNRSITSAVSLHGRKNAGDDAAIAMSRSKARSERKRTREKQRRDGVNKQFAELTKVLKRLELEEREEAERKARIAAGNDSSMSSTTLHSVRLPFIAPNNSVDLIACAIVHLQHLHRLSKKQQLDLNRLDNELRNAKKAGEDTATKLKEVLFNYQAPRPNLGATNLRFNVGNNKSSNNTSSVGMNNNINNNMNKNMASSEGNGNMNLAANASQAIRMDAMMASPNQKQQQVSTKKQNVG